MKSGVDKIEELINLPESLSISDFEKYVTEYLHRKNDKKLAIQEIDKVIGILQNHILSLALYLKQNHLIPSTDHEQRAIPNTFYTKQEIALKYRVSLRTVTNWILDGLKCVEIGGIKRISTEAINDFVNKKRSKKFNWKSVSNPWKK